MHKKKKNSSRDSIIECMLGITTYNTHARQIALFIWDDMTSDVQW